VTFSAILVHHTLLVPEIKHLAAEFGSPSSRLGGVRVHFACRFCSIFVELLVKDLML
jgi:hypothetical protein